MTIKEAERLHKRYMENNPVYAFIIQNAPKEGKNAQFFTYEHIFDSITHEIEHKRSADEKEEFIIAELESISEVLWLYKAIAIQSSAVCDGRRGIRLMDIL